MIYTITTNPSIDYAMEADLIPGQINRARNEAIYPGGKGINVSIVLHRLGEETRALGFAAGHIGQTIRELLDDLQCPHTLLELSGGGQSRINVKIKGVPETAVNGLGPRLVKEDMALLLDLLREVTAEDAVVLSGWTQNVEFYVDIMHQLETTGCMTVLDCTGEALWQCLSCRPFLIKPNLIELGALYGVEDLEYEEGVELAQQIQREGARNVLVSMGNAGAFLLTEKQELYLANACAGQAHITVGAGDSLVAGFLHGFRQTGDFAKALQMGIAAGGATAFSEWLGTKEQILELLEQVQVEKAVL